MVGSRGTHKVQEQIYVRCESGHLVFPLKDALLHEKINVRWQGPTGDFSVWSVLSLIGIWHYMCDFYCFVFLFYLDSLIT